MLPAIPGFPLDALAAPAHQPAAVFFLGPDFVVPPLPIDRPYRSNYYKIGSVLRGSTRLQVNLETYDPGLNSLLLLSPYVIKQRPLTAADCESLSMFFTRGFLAAGGSPNLATFAFFARDARHVLTLPPAAAAISTVLLQASGQKFTAPQAYREAMLHSLIPMLLHETAPSYGAQHTSAQAGQTRRQLPAAKFKKLINKHYAAESGLDYTLVSCASPPSTSPKPCAQPPAGAPPSGWPKPCCSKPRCCCKTPPSPSAKLLALCRPVHVRPVFLH